MTDSVAVLRERLAAELAAAGVGQRAAEIAALGVPCVRLRTTPGQDGEIPVGASKLGGHPDLPDGVEWPEWQGRPLSFAAQLELAEAARHAPEGSFPGAGLLSFFVDETLEASGLYPTDEGGWRVIWLPAGSALTRRAPPAARAPQTFQPCAVEMHAALSLPGDDALIHEHGLDRDDDELLDAIEAVRGECIHQLLGIPRPIQADPAVACQFGIHGVHRRTPPHFDSERAAQVEGGAAEWRLLLQLDSDDNADMMWGDAGMLYFMIREPDLRERRFDRVWMIFQCF